MTNENVNPLDDFINDLTNIFAAGERPNTVTSVFGEHTVDYLVDEELEDEEYALVSFPIPFGVLAVIDGDTYGTLEGLRFPLG